MTPLRKFSALCFSLSLLLHPVTAVGADKRTKSVERGTILHARNNFGLENTYINENGCRIEYPVAGLNLICKKPTYEIVWFNPQAKTVMKESIAEFRERTGQPAIEADMSHMPQKVVEFAGVPAVCITLKLSNNVDKSALPEFSTRSTSSVLHTNFYVLRDVVRNSMLTKFLNTFLHVPASGGVLLAITHDRSDRTTSTDFKVERVERNVAFPAGVFDAPIAGFKTVHSQPDVAQGPGYKKQFDDLARDMGIGVPLGK